MPWYADEEEEEEEIASELPVKAAKEEVVVEPADETENEDSANVSKNRSVITR